MEIANMLNALLFKLNKIADSCGLERCQHLYEAQQLILVIKEKMTESDSTEVKEFKDE